VADLKEFLQGCQLVSFPNYPKKDSPVYHMLTMNFNEDLGISKATYLAAMGAEGAGMFSYIPSPIPTWKRLHWWNYAGPKQMWMENLKRHRIRYDKIRVPNCETKIRRSIEMGWNYIKPSKAKMRKLAQIFHKVEENLAELREWEKKNA